MKKPLLLAALLAAAPFAASAAEELSYTYVEGGYQQTRNDTNDELFGDYDADGGYLRGSVLVSQSFYLFGGYSQVRDNDDVAGFKVEDELKQAEFGVGYRMDMGERLDFLAELAYMRVDENIDVEGNGFDEEVFDEDAKGGRLSLGLRGQMADPLEGWIKVGYVDGGDFSGDFVGTLGLQFEFNRTWGLVGEVEVLDDVTQYKAGVRASF